MKKVSDHLLIIKVLFTVFFISFQTFVAVLLIRGTEWLERTICPSLSYFSQGCSEPWSEFYFLTVMTLISLIMAISSQVFYQRIWGKTGFELSTMILLLLSVGCLFLVNTSLWIPMIMIDTVIAISYLKLRGVKNGPLNQL